MIFDEFGNQLKLLLNLLIFNRQVLNCHLIFRYFVMKFKILCIFSCHLSTNSSRSFHEQLQLRCIIVKLLILIRYVYSAIRILAHRRLLILMLRVFNLLLRRIHVKYAGELLHDLILRQISEHIIPFNVQCIPSSNQSRIRLIERYR